MAPLTMKKIAIVGLALICTLALAQGQNLSPEELNRDLGHAGGQL
jgi:hypothetical protein